MIQMKNCSYPQKGYSTHHFMAQVCTCYTISIIIRYTLALLLYIIILHITLHLHYYYTLLFYILHYICIITIHYYFTY